MNWRFFRLFWMFFLLFAPWAHATTIVSGTIAVDTTWTEAKSPYVVSGISIASGVTLTLEAGVIVKMNGGSFDVNGILHANGTADKKIYFTSIADDSAGGDTNGDGSARSPAPSDWLHIIFKNGSKGELAGIVVRYAGDYHSWQYSYAGIYNLGGDISITGSEFYKNAAYGIRQISGTTTINFSDFHDQYNAVRHEGGFVEISNSNLHHHSYNAIEAYSGKLTLINNNFYNNGYAAGIIDGKVRFTNSQNEASGNFINAFDIFNRIDHDQILSADLPYIGLSVGAGAKVTVEPGAIIKVRGTIHVFGELVAIGTPDNKIYFTSFRDDTPGGDTNGNGATNFPIPGDWVGIYFLPGSIGNFSNAVIRYSGGYYSFSQTRAGIENSGGTVTVVDSQILNNLLYGILQYSGSMNITKSEIAGNGQDGVRFIAGDFTINHSSIHNNPEYGINNLGSIVVSAENNWWGDPLGPRHPTLNPTGIVGNRVSNNVDFTPWLGSDPLLAPPPPPPLPTCCSNVLFLPGLEASRLYGQDGKRLWEPEIDHDNSRLFLNPDGSSIEPNIYTKDILDEALTVNIYKSFESHMHQMVTDGIINQWKAFPYDWRRDIFDIVNNPQRMDIGLSRLIETLEILSDASQTKKVTIIAHSNGGLIGKALIAELERQGKANLVDKFIMVAVPQLGAPKAVATMLHGESMPTDKFPFVMARSTARTLAENMLSAYTLLPSEEYFNSVLDPVVEFDSTTPLTQNYIDNYGVAITNSEELRDFLLGADGRAKPEASDVISPNIANENLLAIGADNHISLDTWQAPEGVEVIQIVGWGVPTLRGIRYFEKIKSFCLFNCLFLDHEPIMTVDGDSTVVVPSAEAIDAQNYYVNMKRYNTFLNLRIDRKHGNILEIPDLLSTIDLILQNQSVTETSFISSDKLIPSPNDDPSLRIKVHSPVSLNIYDADGRHTGISTTTSFFPDNIIDEQIPNSYYIEMGEGKYAGADISGTTTIELIGQDFGVFTLDIEKMNGDALIATSTFKDIPVALGSLASFSTSGNIKTAKLKLDINGDGLVDSLIAPGDGLSTEELIGILIGFIKTLHLSEDREKTLLKKVDKLAKTLSADYYKKQKTEAAFANLVRAIDGYVKKGLLLSTEAAELKNLIGKIQGVVVE